MAFDDNAKSCKETVNDHADGNSEEARLRKQKEMLGSEVDLFDDDRIIELHIAPQGRIVGDEYRYDCQGRITQSGLIIEYSEEELARGPTTMRISVRELKALAGAAVQKLINDGDLS